MKYIIVSHDGDSLIENSANYSTIYNPKSLTGETYITISNEVSPT